jgi:GNAT superfamily N-acetyltransferase
MRLRWDWLEPVIRVPYVPTLGPVAPGALAAGMFDDVIAVSGTGRFLPYDKDQRWTAAKDEHVLVDQILHRPDHTQISTLASRGGGTVKLHHYATEPPDLAEVRDRAAKIAAEVGAGGHRVLWFSADDPDGARNRLMHKSFRPADQLAHDGGPVVELAGCDAAATFAAFTREIGPEGFSFLHERMLAGHDDGPTLVTVASGRIVGAIGPLSTLTDAAGVRFQPPHYFAVHPEHRGRGHGRVLWRAAMDWGARHGAVYKVLQAASGSPAEHLYLSEGLHTLGYLHTA